MSRLKRLFSICGLKNDRNTLNKTLPLICREHNDSVFNARNGDAFSRKYFDNLPNLPNTDTIVLQRYDMRMLLTL
jgi:hypothetical protein